MNDWYKIWVCHNCKFLWLSGPFACCSSQERFNSVDFPLLPEAKSTIALPDNATQCSYKVEGANGVFDRGNKD